MEKKIVETSIMEKMAIGTKHGWGRTKQFGSLTMTLVIALALVGLGVARHAVTPAHAGGAPIAELDWPVYGHDLGGMRYVDTDQINRSTVAGLKPAWIFHTNVMNKETSFESQPIEVGGTLYVSSPHDHVFALDAVTGALTWTYNPSDMPTLANLALCCGQTNRGVAVGGGKVFIARLDANLVALDARSGKVAWQVADDDWHNKWTETMAPQYVDGKVIVGTAGGELRKRGHVSAYDAATGRLLWRFYTVPGPGAPGHETWAGDSWRNGGATVWSTPNVDPALGLLYITTGNASPDENGSARAGKNLYANSIVALDLNTGHLRWHFQEVHHDLWDYDATQPTHLFTLTRDGRDIPAIGHANKDGNYFVLDRRTGAPIYPVTEMPVPAGPAWQHASPTQPMPATEALIPQTVETTPPGVMSAPMFTPPQPHPLLIQPGYESGPEWGAAAYSPRTGYAYIPAGGYEPWLFHAMRPQVNSLGSTAVGAKVPGIATYGLFDAMDTTTGKIAWRIKVPNKTVTGVAVAGDLVFWGQDNGQFDATDARTGKTLWTFQSSMPGVGGANGSPAVYRVEGRAYVVMAFGGNLRERADAPNKTSSPGDALIAFALPAPGQTQPHMVTAYPQQVPTGLPAMVAPLQGAPAGAAVVTLLTHDLNYYPHQFTVRAGQRVAVHLVNTGIEPSSIAVKLPSGPLALQGMVKPHEDAYFVFDAPIRPGTYPFFSPLGPQKFFGMTGVMTVAPAP